MRRNQAFTLAELLIALAILGVIAVFTIPKVLQSQKDSRFNSMTKEAAGTISAAFQTVKMQNSSVSIQTVMDQMNYVKVDTVTVLDDPAGTDVSCSAAGVRCLVLHNGGVLFGIPACTLTTSMTSFAFVFDPDGKAMRSPRRTRAPLFIWSFMVTGS